MSYHTPGTPGWEEHRRWHLAAHFRKNAGDESLREVWRHWSDPKHRNAKTPEFMADIRARIVRLKAGETPPAEVFP